MSAASNAGMVSAVSRKKNELYGDTDTDRMMNVCGGYNNCVQVIQ